ncbi:MAG: UDP-N-acetylmuramate--L-alanine ligase [Planctomycetota bacterium]|nr:MAG: UDP-N-acetylmuramate--L-alanine ligase [Planctomycetota bacterium]
MADPRAEIEHSTTPSASAEPFDVRGKHVFMIGIGGCGMSGLARMLLARGARVAGSDQAPTHVTESLEASGIAIGFDQDRGEITEACDLLIASAAIRADHPEMLAATERGVRTLTYAEALGRCMLGRSGVCIAGTHGKSSITAMLGAALTDAGLDPTVIVGALCSQLATGCLTSEGVPAKADVASDGKSARTGFRLGADSIPTGELAGRPGLLLAESCEFNRSFHHHRPTVAAITSVEADHLDIYGSLDAVVESFAEFARLLPSAEQGGYLLIADEGAHRRQITAGLSCKVETIGFSPAADWVVWVDSRSREVALTFRRELVASWTMQLPGVHNAMNAATACALAVRMGADPARVARSLGAFRGVDRRLQLLGDRPVRGGSVRVYDDYGHHPTEVDATLRALRDFERPQDKDGRLVCVFQPHQHSRTRFLLEEFAQAFSQADIVIVPHIYFVRDTEIEKTKVSAADLVDRLRKRGVRAMHLYPFEAIVEQLENLCQPNDLLVVMGAGPVGQIAHSYMGLPASGRSGA